MSRAGEEAFASLLTAKLGNGELDDNLTFDEDSSKQCGGTIDGASPSDNTNTSCASRRTCNRVDLTPPSVGKVGSGQLNCMLVLMHRCWCYRKSYSPINYSPMAIVSPGSSSCRRRHPSEAHQGHLQGVSNKNTTRFFVLLGIWRMWVSIGFGDLGGVWLICVYIVA